MAAAVVPTKSILKKAKPHPYSRPKKITFKEILSTTKEIHCREDESYKMENELSALSAPTGPFSLDEHPNANNNCLVGELLVGSWFFF